MNSKSEFSVGNLPRLSIAKKEIFDGTNPEPKPKGKVFVFNAGSEKKLKRSPKRRLKRKKKRKQRKKPQMKQN